MGRLIDADKAIEDMKYYHDDCAQTSEYTRLGFETAIEVIRSAPIVEAIPKDQYEAKLKADLKAILVELQLEIEEKKFLESSCYFMDKTEEKNYAVYTDDISEIIQQKIGALEEVVEDGNDRNN